MTNTELKAYTKSKLSFEDEKVLEEVAKRMEKVLENSLFGMTKTDNIDFLSKKKQLEEAIEKFLESNSRGRVKDYSLVLDGNKDKREFHLQGYIELR